MLSLPERAVLRFARMTRAEPVDDAIEDAALARRVIGGDGAAEAELCRRLVPRVRAWGLKHLRDETAALDLAQQVLLATLEALRGGRVEKIDTLAAFVLGVCKNTLFAWKRGEKRRAGLLERFGPSFASEVRIDDCALDRRRLEGCFDRLAPRARAILSLTFFAERTGDEIASELGISTANVRVLRHRALADLHQCMESMEGAS
jgi:RNA polymerase sigma-70 factor (ECF subfamily)